MVIDFTWPDVILRTAEICAIAKIPLVIGTTGLKKEQLGKFREVAWNAQKMSRIGNWVSTWEREIDEKDFTSGVFVYALDSGVISINDIQKGNKSKIIKKIRNSKIERKLLKEWEQNYYEINKLARKIKSVDVRSIPQALEKVLFFHLSSRGYK